MIRPTAQLFYANCPPDVGLSAQRGWGVRSASASAPDTLPARLKPYAELPPNHADAMVLLQPDAEGGAWLGRIKRVRDFESRVSAFSHLMQVDGPIDPADALALWYWDGWCSTDAIESTAMPEPNAIDPAPEFAPSQVSADDAKRLLAVWVHAPRLSFVCDGPIDEAIRVLQAALDRLPRPLREGIDLAIGTRRDAPCAPACWLTGEGDTLAFRAADGDALSDALLGPVADLEGVAQRLAEAGVRGFAQAALYMRMLWLGKAVDLETANQLSRHEPTHIWPELRDLVTHVLVEEFVHSSIHANQDSRVNVAWLKDVRNSQRTVEAILKVLLAMPIEQCVEVSTQWVSDPPHDLSEPDVGWTCAIIRAVERSGDVALRVMLWQRLIDNAVDTHEIGDDAAAPSWVSLFPTEPHLITQLIDSNAERLRQLLCLRVVPLQAALDMISDWPQLEREEAIDAVIAAQGDQIESGLEAFSASGLTPVCLPLSRAGIKASALTSFATRDLLVGELTPKEWLAEQPWPSEFLAQVAALVVASIRKSAESGSHDENSVQLLTALAESLKDLHRIVEVDQQLSTTLCGTDLLLWQTLVALNQHESSTSTSLNSIKAKRVGLFSQLWAVKDRTLQLKQKGED